MFMVTFGFTSFLIPTILIIAFFSGEMIWRDRTTKFMELLDSTPVKNAPLLLGKWIAMAFILATLCLLAIAIGIIVQVAAGGTPVNLGLYLKFAAFNVMPNYLALAFLALFVQTFAPNRIVGMIFAMGAMIITTFFLSRLPFYHPLMGFGGTSPGALSEISPYNSWVYFRWFNSYFGALCGIFAIIGIWLWRRGLQVGLGQRFKQMKSQITPISGGLAALFLATFIGTGAYIYKAYDKVDWQNSKAQEKSLAAMEKMLEREVDLPLPKITSVSIDADIYPEQQEATIGGVFKFENQTDTPITELYVMPASGHKEDVKRFEIDGAMRVTEGENADGDTIKDLEKYGMALFKFDPPLAPGDKSVLEFETFFHAPRLADRSVISKNGTFLNNYGNFQTSSRALPVIGIGYQPMQNPDKRRKYDLPELEKRPARTDMKARQNNLFGPTAGYIDFDANICTSEAQIPIAPGDFKGETIKDGRRCRAYKSDKSFINFYSILSADFAVTEDSWTSPTGKVIPIRIYHNENHTYSVPDIIDALKFSLSHYTEHFGPYQFNYVRVMEVPFISFAQAFAGTIPYAEQGFIMDSCEADDPKTLDNAAQTTMHEIGHQWFAHQIVPADTRGYNVLSEGLTSYATMDAYEAKYGFDKALYALEKSTIEGMIALQFLDRSKEEPLGVASTQQYLVYNKADWVMWGLKHYIGPEKVRAAMRALLADYGQTGAPYPTTLEVTQYLKDAAGPDYHQLIEDQWERITYWDLKYGEDDVKVSPNADDGYTVEIPFKLDKKISTEEIPDQTSVTEIDGEDLNEWVEIGFYKNKPKDKWSDWIALEKVRVSEAESTLRFTVSERPNHIALDPRRLLQERNVTDNVKALPKQVASN
jgi:ABC-type transport system involved in multi-copper enzyme maturation permease subunit